MRDATTYLGQRRELSKAIAKATKKPFLEVWAAHRIKGDIKGKGFSNANN